MHVVNPAAIVSGILGVAYLLVGALALWVSPRAPMNRAFATFSLGFGVNIAAALVQLMHVDRSLAYNLELFRSWTITVTVLGYLWFVGIAADTPLARPFRSRAFVAVALLILLAWTATLYFGAWTLIPTWEFDPTLGAWRNLVVHPAFYVLNTVNAVLFLYTFFAFVSAYRRAPPGSIARRRAGALALALGLQDAVLVLVLLGSMIVFVVAPSQYDAYDYWAGGIIGSGIVVIALVLLARAVLKYQLFDFDLRLKATLARALLAGAFFVVFFAVEQLAQQWLSQELGFLAGGVAAALLVFALRPLERASRRVADAVMPRTAPTDDYLAARKLDVYRAALEAAREAGALTEKDHANLARLREKLGLAPDEVARLDESTAPAEANAA